MITTIYKVLRTDIRQLPTCLYLSWAMLQLLDPFFSKSKSFPRQLVTLSTATVQLSLPQISATDDNKLLLVSLIIIIN